MKTAFAKVCALALCAALAACTDDGDNAAGNGETSAADPAGAPATGRWDARAAMPTARQEIYVDSDGKTIYVGGGILGDGLAFTDVFEAYDSAADSWATLPPLPEARHHITLSRVGDKIYGMGGFQGPFPDWRAQADVFVYDIATDRWAAGVPLPEPRGEHVSAVVNGRIFIIGGRVRQTPDAATFFEHVDSTLNQAFDPAAGTWEDRAAAPTARNSAAAAVIDGKIYVVGGRENVRQDDGSQLQHNLPNLEVYDPATDTWETRAPMPQAQGGLAAAALNGRLYAFGGEVWTPAQRVDKEAWVYDPGSDTWRAVAPMPTPRHGLAAAAAGDAIYVLGGATAVGGGAAVGTNERFVP